MSWVDIAFTLSSLGYSGEGSWQCIQLGTVVSLWRTQTWLGVRLALQSCLDMIEEAGWPEFGR